MNKNITTEKKIAIIGLGYVGLPLAVEFGKYYKTIGFDINTQRVSELKNNIDITLECSTKQICSSTFLSFTDNIEDIKEFNIYIITVPTPIDKHSNPDLTPLINASKMISKVISAGNIVIYESTVYPGATEDDCIPIIEKYSGLKFNIDFFAGYSPERINPGDKVNTLTKIKKITSGSTIEAANLVDNLYSSIITAGTFKASSIKVAEAAKIIENTQRDVNIALMNEFAMMFKKMGISTHDVLDAASTKWNFIKLAPGLVGGHCIGVDPYYLLQKANEFNYSPNMIRTAREINNSMAGFICDHIIESMVMRSMIVPNSDVLILGATFKENCPDIRNTKIVDIYKSLKRFNINVDIYDPNIEPVTFKQEYNINAANTLNENKKYHVIALMVAHSEFINDKNLYSSLLRENGFIYDLKSKISKNDILDIVSL
ncbi:TPA: nucleotide sugar dehydrogenase [Providencia rettgeri]|uniref:nucleotide sugar dehydrogenase n=1 Tax=Providencia sp. VP23HZSY-1 TaxID=3391806 RepID=UPI0025C9DF31|nr:nucleotide sugar dehydrogenase [Providencia rettgeri]ELR5187732.1 nucleotide sugar dehydrogenase [Providencia rettgeri]EMB0752230.1 nucleotide sugar dehydrogenase [Providencia rettgeri]HEM7509417.1 nucleotide sugar dehydrogenase [Providencia rettgeri]HEM8269165.1 nucleotide sugar dehydrogenase [Providencia rettgeri]